MHRSYLQLQITTSPDGNHQTVRESPYYLKIRSTDSETKEKRSRYKQSKPCLQDVSKERAHDMIDDKEVPQETKTNDRMFERKKVEVEILNAEDDLLAASVFEGVKKYKGDGDAKKSKKKKKKSKKKETDKTTPTKKKKKKKKTVNGYERLSFRSSTNDFDALVKEIQSIL